MEKQKQYIITTSHGIEIEVFRGYPDVLNLKEMSELLQISTKTGRRLLNNGEISSFRIGRSYRIPKENLISFIYGSPPNVLC